MKKKFRTPYSVRSDAYGSRNDEPSLTQQSDAADLDINVIMKRYGGSGMLPQVTMQPLYGDFSETGDFSAAKQRVLEAEDAFLTIPADIRARFDNDPGKFIEFATNPDNLEKLQEMGLADAPPRKPDEPRTPREINRGIPPRNISKEEEETQDAAARNNGREDQTTGGTRRYSDEGEQIIREPQNVRSPQPRSPR